MKVGFEAILCKLGSKAEKSGWTYISSPVKVTEKLKPGFKKSFRVKGSLDQFLIKSVALVPMGEGQFIMAINATMRKAIRKNIAAKVFVQIELDYDELPLSAAFLECLKEEPDAINNFNKLPPSHQQYYSKWIESAKTDATKIKRIAMAVNGLARNMDYGAMLKEERANKSIR